MFAIRYGASPIFLFKNTPTKNLHAYINKHKYPIEDERYVLQAWNGFCVCEEKSCLGGLSGPGYTDSWTLLCSYICPTPFQSPWTKHTVRIPRFLHFAPCTPSPPSKFLLVPLGQVVALPIFGTDR